MIRYILLPALTGAVLAAIGIGLAVSLRRSPAVQASAWRDDQPASYLTDLGEHAADAIAVTAPCARCDLGLGHCVCTVRCVADACTGRTTFVTWTEHDFTFAARHGFSLPERSELQ
jgi:hypothetical protein